MTKKRVQPGVPAGGQFAEQSHAEVVIELADPGAPAWSRSAFGCEDCGQITEDPGEAAYECSRCGATQIEENRCRECNVFMAKISDDSCTECDEPGPLNKVAAFESLGRLFATIEEAEVWADGLEIREAHEEKSRARLSAHLDDRRAERVARNTVVLPALRRLAGVFDKTRFPQMRASVDASIEILEIEPDGSPYQIRVPYTEMVRFKLGAEADADLALASDYHQPYEDRDAVTRRLTAQLLPLLTTREFQDRVTPFSGTGEVMVVDPDHVIAEFTDPA